MLAAGITMMYGGRLSLAASIQNPASYKICTDLHTFLIGALEVFSQSYEAQSKVAVSSSAQIKFLSRQIWFMRAMLLFMSVHRGKLDTFT